MKTKSVMIKCFTTASLGTHALRKRKKYLKNTQKPDNTSVKQWINMVMTVDSWLPLIPQNTKPFSKEDLIS